MGKEITVKVKVPENHLYCLTQFESCFYLKGFLSYKCNLFVDQYGKKTRLYKMSLTGDPYKCEACKKALQESN